VATDTAGNMIRAPNRSVSAPTGIRPIEPTTTGTATSSDWAAKLRPRRSLTPGPRGPSSAHAQKLTVNPMVARARFRPEPAGTVLAPDGLLDAPVTALRALISCYLRIVNGGGRADWSAISAGLPSQDESDADQDGDRGTGTPHTGGSGNPPER
jgi:hypothetical protein